MSTCQHVSFKLTSHEVNDIFGTLLLCHGKKELTLDLAGACTFGKKCLRTVVSSRSRLDLEEGSISAGWPE